MKSPTTLRSWLRRSAGLVILATFGTWFVTGSHFGWTRTRTLEMHHDEVTGIDYPVQRPTFVAGVEFPAAGIAAATTLLAASLLTARRQTPGSTPLVRV